MTITLAEFMTKLNTITQDMIVGTTDSDGESDGTTLVDSALQKYADGYFGDPNSNVEWWARIEGEVRAVKKSLANGSVSVFKALSSQVIADTPYELHRFDPFKKVAAINQALFDCYPYFHKRLEDTSLTGKGSSDNQYQVPSTFDHFPEQIFTRDLSGTIYTDTEITNYTTKDIGGVLYIYADITSGDTVLLIGKAPLTQFTMEEGEYYLDEAETELTSAQADIVAQLAASIFYHTRSSVVNSTDSGRYDSLATRYEDKYNERKEERAQPKRISTKLDWSWLDG